MVELCYQVLFCLRPIGLIHFRMFNTPYLFRRIIPKGLFGTSGNYIPLYCCNFPIKCTVKLFVCFLYSTDFKNSTIQQDQQINFSQWVIREFNNKKKPVSTLSLQKLKMRSTIRVILVGLVTSFPKLNQFNRLLKILHMVCTRSTSWPIHKTAASVNNLKGNHTPLRKSRFSWIYIVDQIWT